MSYNSRLNRFSKDHIAGDEHIADRGDQDRMGVSQERAWRDAMSNTGSSFGFGGGDVAIAVVSVGYGLSWLGDQALIWAGHFFA